MNALTDGTGAIAERYAYSAYGEPVFVSASGTLLMNSAKDNRYTYTGREWDEELSLYHFRARMYDAESGRFLGADAIRFIHPGTALYVAFASTPPNVVDYSGNWSESPDSTPQKRMDPYKPGGPPGIRICFRWSNHIGLDPGQLKGMGKYKSQWLKDNQKINRDCAIKAYREGMAWFVKQLDSCCKRDSGRYAKLCPGERNIIWDFLTEPYGKGTQTGVEQPGFPKDVIPGIRCSNTGHRVLITTGWPGKPRSRKEDDPDPWGFTYPFKGMFVDCNGPCSVMAHEFGHCGHYKPQLGKECDGEGNHHNDANNLMCCWQRASHDPLTTYVDDQWCDAALKLIK